MLRDYLANRFGEKSTHFGLGMLIGGFALTALTVAFPQYALLINSIAATAGVGLMAVPTK